MVFRRLIVLLTLNLIFSRNYGMGEESYGKFFHHCLRGENEAVSSMLLKHRELAILKDGIQVTPLHIAAQQGNLELVDLLLKAGACVHQRDRYGMTPLHVAVQFGDFYDVVELLLQAGANINATTFFSWRPSYYWVDKFFNRGEFDKRRPIINPKCRVISINGRGEEDEGNILTSTETQFETIKTPLHSALERNYINSARLLLEAGARCRYVDVQNLFRLNPLLQALYNDELTELLPTARGHEVRSTYLIALAQRRFEASQKCLPYLNSEEVLPLLYKAYEYAVIRGDRACYQWLNQFGRPDENTITKLLLLAIKGRKLRMAGHLIKSHAGTYQSADWLIRFMSLRNQNIESVLLKLKEHYNQIENFRDRSSRLSCIPQDVLYLVVAEFCEGDKDLIQPLALLTARYHLIDRLHHNMYSYFSLLPRDIIEFVLNKFL